MKVINLGVLECGNESGADVGYAQDFTNDMSTGKQYLHKYDKICVLNLKCRYIHIHLNLHIHIDGNVLLPQDINIVTWGATVETITTAAVVVVSGEYLGSINL